MSSRALRRLFLHIGKRATQRLADLTPHVAAHITALPPNGRIVCGRSNLPLVEVLAGGINRVDEVLAHILRL